MELAPDYTAMSSDELDRAIDELTKQEARISYMRSIIQARLDLLIDERDERRGRRLDSAGPAPSSGTLAPEATISDLGHPSSLLSLCGAS